MALSVSRRTLLEKLVSENVPLGELQKIHGFNYRTVRNLYPEYRVRGSREASGSVISHERREVLDSLVRAGVTMTDISKLHGFNYKTVRRYHPHYRNKASYLRGEYYDIPKKTRRFVKELVDERASLKEIMDSTGLTRSQVLWLEPNSPWTKHEAGKWRHIVEGAWDLGISM